MSIVKYEAAEQSVARYKAGFFDQSLEGYSVRPTKINLNPAVRSLFYYPKENCLLVSHIQNGRLHIIDLTTGKTRFHDQHGRTIRKVGVFRNEIITASWDASVRVVDFNSLAPRLFLTDDLMGRTPFFFVSEEENAVYVFCYDSDKDVECLSNRIRKWSLETGELLGITGDTGNHISFLSSGSTLVHENRLYVVSDSGYLTIHDPVSMQIIDRLFINENLRTFCCVPAFGLLAIADLNGYVHLFDIRRNCLVGEYRCHFSDISSIKAHPSKPDVIITSSFDGTVKFWELPDFRQTVHADTGGQHLWTFTLKDDLLITGGDNGDIWVFDTSDPEACSLRGIMNVLHDSIAVSKEGSKKFFTNDISNFELINDKTNQPATGKQAEYLLNLCNSESVIRDVFHTASDMDFLLQEPERFCFQLKDTFS